MTAKELKTLFEDSGMRQVDFIRWAGTNGSVVSRASVSQHVTGAVNINKWAVLAYRWFFSHYLPKP